MAVGLLYTLSLLDAPSDAPQVLISSTYSGHVLDFAFCYVRP